MEADVFQLQRPELSIEIDGNIGENSTFHQTHGYYARGVGEDTATLPEGWRQRLVPIHNPNTNNATGWCLEIHTCPGFKLVGRRTLRRRLQKADGAWSSWAYSVRPPHGARSLETFGFPLARPAHPRFEEC